MYDFCQQGQEMVKKAKPFYFWQTVSKRPNFLDLAIKSQNGNPEAS